MKIVIAPDKYKSNMDSPTVCRIIRDAFLKVMPEAQIIELPMADGGEGTVRALTAAAGGTFHKAVVSDPLGRRTTAVFGLFNQGKTAVMEMSSASGIALLQKTELNPLKTSTYGTGELIRAILDHGAREIIIGIGGSATVDGGAGMAQALGFRLLDQNHQELEKGGGSLIHLQEIDISHADPRLKETTFHTACDVTSPLLGPKGAAAVFGPQKGATPEMVQLLEKGLSRLSEIWKTSGLLSCADQPGDGAAGGLGAGLKAFCKARFRSGAQLIMNALKFKENIADADLVITGEGKTDSQTEAGKICGEIAAAAHEEGVPVLLLSGSLEGNVMDFFKIFDYAFSTSSGHTTLEATLAHSREDLAFSAENIARIWERSSVR